MTREKNKVTVKNLIAILKKAKNYTIVGISRHLTEQGLPTTKASRPAEARTSFSDILYKVGIHPRKVSGSSGSLEAASFCLFRAA